MMPDDIATSEQIHEARPDIPLQTIRYHIRQGAPWFPGARQIGRTWVVPTAEAENYCQKYERYARLDKGAGEIPSVSPAPAPTQESCCNVEQ